MYNNTYGNFNIPQGTGFQFMGAQQAAPQKINNLLSGEEIQRLVQRENEFSLQLTETETLRAACNHRRADGLDDAIVEDPITGVSRCSICGYEFRPLDVQTSPESIKDACDTINDILQTIKIIYTTIPGPAAREYFQIIPLIEKIPKLFEYAVKDYTKHVQYDPYLYNNRNMSTMNLFNMLCGTMSQGQPYPQPIDPNMAAQQAPQFNPGYMAPGYVAPQPGYAMPMSNVSNGFGYGAPQQQYAPGTFNYQYNPQQPVAPAPQAQPAPTPVDATAQQPTTTTTAGFTA